MENHQAQKLPVFNKLMYALGQFGWSLTSFGVADLLIYFYLPPEPGEEIIFPTFISEHTVLAVFTIVGLIASVGRIFDAFTDPVIAGWSDRSKSKFGRRRKFLAIAVLPFALFSVLIFLPPSNHPGALNVVWLSITIMILYVSMTMYVTPYNALISELGHDSDERLSISTYLSFTWAMGFGLGMMIFVFQGMLEPKFGSVRAFQIIISVYAILGFIMMMLPIIFIDEDKYCNKTISAEDTLSAVRGVFANKIFRKYIWVEGLYWLAQNFIIMGLSYYVTVLMNLDKSFTTLVMGCVFLASIVYYIPVNRLVLKFGKKKLLQFGFVLFMFSFVFTASLGLFELPLWLIIGIYMILAAFPMAIFGIIPNALVADISDLDGQETGVYKAATFYSMKFFMMKIGLSLSNVIFPSLLIFGKSSANPLGIRLTAIAALIFSICGYLMMRRVPEVVVLHQD